MNLSLHMQNHHLRSTTTHFEKAWSTQWFSFVFIVRTCRLSLNMLFESDIFVFLLQRMWLYAPSMSHSNFRLEWFAHLLNHFYFFRWELEDYVVIWAQIRIYKYSTISRKLFVSFILIHYRDKYGILVNLFQLADSIVVVGFWMILRTAYQYVHDV